MQARLTFHLPHLPTRAFTARHNGEFLLGRDPECEFLLDDDRVSRRHARLAAVDDGWQLTDLGSKNGTTVEGQPIGTARLADGVWLSLGGLLGRFELLTEERRLEEAAAFESRWRTSVSMQRGLTPSLGLETLLKRLLRSVLTLSEGERGLVLLSSPGGDLELAARASVSDRDLESDEFTASVGAIRQVVETGRPVVTSDVRSLTGLGRRESILREGIRGMVCVPLVALERFIGVIYVDSKQPGASFGELDLEILEGLASHAALAISVARLDTELKGLAADLPTQVGAEPETALRLRRELATVWDRSLPVVDSAQAPKPQRPRQRGEQPTWSHLVELHRREPDGDR